MSADGLANLGDGAQAVAARQLDAMPSGDAGAVRLAASPVLTKYHKLMATTRNFQINVMGNNSHYLDNVHTFTMELLRYCEPDSLPWDHSDNLGVSWGTLKRSFVSSSPRPCRLNFVVDARARASLEQWLGRVFSMSAFYTSDQTPALEAAEIPGLEQCHSRRKVRPALSLPGPAFTDGPQKPSVCCVSSCCGSNGCTKGCSWHTTSCHDQHKANASPGGGAHHGGPARGWQCNRG